MVCEDLVFKKCQTWGFKEEEFILLANLIDKALKNIDNEEVLDEISRDVLELTKKFPINQ